MGAHTDGEHSVTRVAHSDCVGCAPLAWLLAARHTWRPRTIKEGRVKNKELFLTISFNGFILISFLHDRTDLMVSCRHRCWNHSHSSEAAEGNVARLYLSHSLTQHPSGFVSVCMYVDLYWTLCVTLIYGAFILVTCLLVFCSLVYDVVCCLLRETTILLCYWLNFVLQS